MLAQLVALSDGSSILLDKPVLLLGRHPECDIQIDSRKISRRHCCIAMVSSYLVVRDLGSTNGLRINGVRVTEGRLKPGDELTIGNHRYEVRWGAPEPAARAAEMKAAAAPEPCSALDDEELEACEEPVPLAESPSVLPRLARPAERRPAAAEHPDDAAAPESPRPPPASLIVPDGLDLAPVSDVLPPPAPPPQQPPA